MPCSSPAWARIGHDQALRANLTGPAPRRHIYSANARTRRYGRLRSPATAGRRLWLLRPRSQVSDPAARAIAWMTSGVVSTAVRQRP
jgi:hypothetical protein